VRGTGTVSFVVEALNAGDVAFLLDQAFDIAVRSGLHCAPAAHRILGTLPDGTVRVSPGFSTVEEDIDFFLDSLGTLLSRRRS
jgi:selenocysteine lyase/cysteine desulfurase